MTAQQEIEQIDQLIDANHRALLQRVHFMPATAGEYQAAWDRNPVLWVTERELYRQRGNAQVRRDQEINRAYEAEQRRFRASRRKKQAIAA